MYSINKSVVNQIWLLTETHRYHLQSTYLGVSLCELRRKVADLMFLFDLLNGKKDSYELIAMVGFNVGIYGTRSQHFSLSHL